MRQLPSRHASEATEPRGDTSKSKLKAAMQALQDVGKELIELSDDKLKKVPLSDELRAAVLDARRFTANEARRRQLQYIGRLMRETEVAPIAAALASFERISGAERARQHRLEKLREDLLADEKVLTVVAREHPRANVQHLRQLRRNALKERETGKPPAAYRALFRELKSLVDNPQQEEGSSE